MKLKNKIAALSTLLIFQLSAANAESIDDELAVIAAEQNDNGEQVETFDPNSLDSDKNKKKTRKEIEEEEKRLEKEREEARKKIKEERKRSRDELSGKTPISKNPAPVERKPNDNSPVINPEVKPVQAVQPVEEKPPAEEKKVEKLPTVEPPKVNQPQNVTLPNPIKVYASFNEIVQAVNFTPLYVPKKSGYTITSIMTIDERLAEVRYSRKWEPDVSLQVRTYRRAEGEELKDISGVHGVKWRVNAVNDTTVYIAKIDENKNVAAWAVGNYTFSAYVENLSFVAFHALVYDELVDLSNHYYLGY